jgi:hypothetical protein
MFCHFQLAVALKVDSDGEKNLKLLKELREQYPKVHAPQRLALNVAEGMIALLL